RRNFAQLRVARRVLNVARMSWYGDAWDAVSGAASSAYDSACDVGKTATQYIDKGKDAVAGGVNTAENWVDKNSHARADQVSDSPVGGTAAQMAADGVTAYTNFEGGVVKGATDMIGGVANAVAHPIDTVAGLNAMAQHIPGPVGDMARAGNEAYKVATGGVGDAVNNAFNRLAHAQSDIDFWKGMGNAIADPYKKEIADGKYAEALGRGAFDIGSLLAGAGEAGAASKTAEGAALANDAAKGAGLAHDAGKGAALGHDTAKGGRAGQGAAHTAR